MILHRCESGASGGPLLPDQEGRVRAQAFGEEQARQRRQVQADLDRVPRAQAGALLQEGGQGGTQLQVRVGHCCGACVVECRK